MYADEFEDEEIEYYAVRPNKSAIKREIAGAVEFIEQLVALSAAQLAQFELDDELREALLLAARIPSSGARKRQIKYIGGLLRKRDVAPLQEHLARLQSKSAHAVREHHLAERWRDQLINGSEQDVNQLLAEFPTVDRQALRQLVRSAKKEQSLAIPPKHTRLLYRYLKEQIT